MTGGHHGSCRTVLRVRAFRRLRAPALERSDFLKCAAHLTFTDSAILMALEVFFFFSFYLKELIFFSKYLVLLMNVVLFCFGLLAVNVCEDNTFYRLLYILSAY